MSRAYDRSNQFSGGTVSDGQAIGVSREVQGLGTPAVITLNNPGHATVSMQRRRADTDDLWSYIGVTVTDSTVHRMHLASNMAYRWRILASGTELATLSMIEAIPSSFREFPELLDLVPYSDGFPGPDDGITPFLASVSQNEITLKWSLSRAQSGYWTAQNPICLGSNGLIYTLNPDIGAGIPGNPEVDPTSAGGTTSSSWIAIGSAGTNVSTDHVAATAPTVGTVPGDLPSGSFGGLMVTHLRFYNNALVVYVRGSGGFAESFRWIPPSTTTVTNSGLTETQVNALIATALDGVQGDKFLGAFNPAASQFPVAKQNQWIVWTAAGTANGQAVKKGQAWYCSAASATLGQPLSWTIDLSRSYAELTANDGRYLEVYASKVFTTAEMHATHQRIQANLRYGSMVHEFPVALPTGYTITYVIPAYVNGNTLTVQIGNGLTYSIKGADGVADADGKIQASRAGEFTFENKQTIGWQVIRSIEFNTPANLTGLTPPA